MWIVDDFINGINDQISFGKAILGRIFDIKIYRSNSNEDFGQLYNFGAHIWIQIFEGKYRQKSNIIKL